MAYAKMNTHHWHLSLPGTGGKERKNHVLSSTPINIINKNKNSLHEHFEERKCFWIFINIVKVNPLRIVKIYFVFGLNIIFSFEEMEPDIVNKYTVMANDYGKFYNYTSSLQHRSLAPVSKSKTKNHVNPIHYQAIMYNIEI